MWRDRKMDNVFSMSSVGQDAFISDTFIHWPLTVDSLCVLSYARVVLQFECVICGRLYHDDKTVVENVLIGQKEFVVEKTPWPSHNALLPMSYFVQVAMFLFCFFLFYCFENPSIAHNFGTTILIQVRISAKCISPNEHFSQIENQNVTCLTSGWFP